jgi:hypothetical protein
MKEHEHLLKVLKIYPEGNREASYILSQEHIEHIMEKR